MNYSTREFKNRGDKPTKSGFGEGLKEAGHRNKQIIALGADITASVGMNFFAETFPDRFYSLGIAEQNCVGVAAGMALAGKIPVFSTYGVFAALRTTDQIRVSVCYNNLHVIIGGAHAGISVGPDGATHQALEDLAIMRVLPNMTVFSPCDYTQTKLAIKAAVEDVKGPVYIRFGREAVPDFTATDMEFIPGKGQLYRQGKDIAIIATGHMVWEALQAAKELKQQGVSVAVANIHTLKPIDEELLVNLAQQCGKIITVEEHQVIGGLGSAVTEVLSEKYPVPVRRIGMNDRFGESGSPAELMQKYGLNADAICKHALEMLNK